MDTEHESGGYTWRHLCCWTRWPQTWCFLYGHAVKANQHQVSVHTSMYLYVLVCTCMYWYIPLWVQILIKRTVDQGWGSRSSSSALSTTGTYLSDGTGSIASSRCEPRKPNSQCHYNLLVHDTTYKFIPVWTCIYWYVLVCTGMYMYNQVQASMYWYVLVCTDIYRPVTVIYRYVPVHIITC